MVDKLGLCLEGEYLVVYIPPLERAMVFRILSRRNRGFEAINYGPLPLPSGTNLATFEGTSTSVPADGVLPARAYTPTGITFPYTGAIDKDDMWYLTEDYRDTLFHVIQYVTPAWLRIDLQIPPGTDVLKFQRDKVRVGITSDFGFVRGKLETVHFPRVHYGFRYANDTNMPVYTFVKFYYAEYKVEIPKNAELIFDILNKKVPSHWYTLPIGVSTSDLVNALTEIYGITGFPLYRIDQKSEAIEEYEKLLKEVTLKEAKEVRVGG